MITCPNCQHQNPESALQCENCYSSLSENSQCPNCGSSVQVDAAFCGQCGFNLQAVDLVPELDADETIITSELNIETSPAVSTMSSPMASPWDEEEENAVEELETAESDFAVSDRAELREPPATSTDLATDSEPETMAVEPEPVEDIETLDDVDTEIDLTPFSSDTDLETSPWDFIETPSDRFESESEQRSPVELEPEPVAAMEEFAASSTAEEELERDFIPTESVAATEEPTAESLEFDDEAVATSDEPATSSPTAESVVTFADSNIAASAPTDAGFDTATRLQTHNISLLHIQTNTVFKIPQHLEIVHIGKPNSKVPPDVDVANLDNSEVVSRVHADLRIEGDIYFLEDVGSSNGTYVNHVALVPGNRHRLRAGDRIALGKGDLVSFIFQID